MLSKKRKILVITIFIVLLTNIGKYIIIIILKIV